MVRSIFRLVITITGIFFLVTITGCDKEDKEIAPEAPFKYELYLKDKYDSSPLPNIAIIIKYWSSGIDADYDYTKIGNTDENGYFSISNIYGDEESTILIINGGSTLDGAESYADFYTETIYRQNKVSVVSLTTYGKLNLLSDKVNSYDDQDSLFLFIDGSAAGEFKCNSAPQILLDKAMYRNDSHRRHLAHQNHTIKWTIKKGSVFTDYEHTIFFEPLKEHSYTIEY